MLKSILTCAVLCAAMLAAGCNRDASAGGVAEKVSENTYRNAAFGLTVTAPDGWFVADNGQTKRLMDVGAEAIAGENARLKALAEASKQTTSFIFTFFKHPLGAPVEFNPSVGAVAENVAMAPGVKTGQDYFFHVRNLIKQSNIPTEVVGGYSVYKIGGHAFDKMDVRMSVEGITVNQRYYAARRDSHMIVIVQSYLNEAQRLETQAVLDSIKLDW